MEPNTHKYRLKLKEDQWDTVCQQNTVNVSRSVGIAGNWVGCGYIDKTGNRMDHADTRFPFYSLVYVIEGQGEYIDEHGDVHPLGSGSVFQRRPWICHSTRIDPRYPWREYYIDLDETLYEQLAAVGLIEKRVPVYRVHPDPALSADFEALMRQLDTSVERRLPDVALNVIGMIRDLVNQGKLLTGDQGVEAMIEKSCIDFNRSLDKRIDLREYCRSNGWGYESFRKAFKNAIGLSPGQYILRRRMDTASRMLRSTTLRVSEIAAALGYQTPYAFSNQFKRQFGVFPTQFRGREEHRAAEAQTPS